MFCQHPMISLSKKWKLGIFLRSTQTKCFSIKKMMMETSFLPEGSELLSKIFSFAQNSLSDYETCVRGVLLCKLQFIGANRLVMYSDLCRSIYNIDVIKPKQLNTMRIKQDINWTCLTEKKHGSWNNSWVKSWTRSQWKPVTICSTKHTLFRYNNLKKITFSVANTQFALVFSKCHKNNTLIRCSVLPQESGFDPWDF